VAADRDLKLAADAAGVKPVDAREQSVRCRAAPAVPRSVPCSRADRRPRALRPAGAAPCARSPPQLAPAPGCAECTDILGLCRAHVKAVDGGACFSAAHASARARSLRPARRRARRGAQGIWERQIIRARDELGLVAFDDAGAEPEQAMLDTLPPDLQVRRDFQGRRARGRRRCDARLRQTRASSPAGRSLPA